MWAEWKFWQLVIKWQPVFKFIHFWPKLLPQCTLPQSVKNCLNQCQSTDLAMIYMKLGSQVRKSSTWPQLLIKMWWIEGVEFCKERSLQRVRFRLYRIKVTTEHFSKRRQMSKCNQRSGLFWQFCGDNSSLD